MSARAARSSASCHACIRRGRTRTGRRECKEETRARGYSLAAQLVDRAKKHGSQRKDFSPEDLVYLLIANGTVAAATSRIKPTVWKCYVALFLDG